VDVLTHFDTAHLVADGVTVQDHGYFRVTLEQLIALKLDSWSGSPARRLKDKAGVIELMKVLELPRDLKIVEAVRGLYVETWDALQADPE